MDKDLLQEDLNETRKISRFTKLIGIITTLTIIIAVSISVILLSNTLNNIKVEVKELKVEVERGNERNISLKEDAFKVIDDTEIPIEELEDGLSRVEIEKILNNHKYGDEGIPDGDMGDQKQNITKFNYMWGIENGYTIDHDFKDRLSYTHSQHLWQIDWDFFNQRSIPKIGNIICVPSSAVLLLNALGYDVDIRDVLNYFKDNEELITYVRSRFGDWIEKYISQNKLYQITGSFTKGLNMYLSDHYPEFPYQLDFNYWTIGQIAEYVENFGLMSATYFPSYVLRGEREGGHMIVISKVYRDWEGNIIGFGITDPFGNPNVQYRGARGWDGHNVVIDLRTMVKVMKSYNDDHGRGPTYLYRVLYFKDK